MTRREASLILELPYVPTLDTHLWYRTMTNDLPTENGH